MSNIINALGAGSGIDTKALVDGLVEAESSVTESRLTKKEESSKAQISAYGTLKSSLSEFQNILSPLSNNDTFNSRSVAFPDTDQITPDKLDANAQTGSYQIEVTQVASAQSLAFGATSQSDKDAPLGNSGKMAIQFGAWSYNEPTPGNFEPSSFAVNDQHATLEIEIEATDSLESIAKKINDQDSDLQASVLLVDGNYQLMLTAPSGEKNALRISVDDASLSNFSFTETNHSGVQETLQGNDAKLKINGLEVSRDSNTITDVIPGFEFTVNKSTPGEKVNFSVNADSSIAKQAITDFVEAYNTLFETVGNLTGYSRDEDNNLVAGDLSKDSTAKNFMNGIRDLIASSVPGLDSGLDALTNIGIRTQLDGKLEIIDKEFDKAFSENFDEIEGLFATQTTTSSNYVDLSLGSNAANVNAGSYDVVITRDPAKASTTGAAITPGSLPGFDSANDSFTTPLDTSTGEYSFEIQVGGYTSEVISLNGTYNSPEEMRAEMQSLINGDENIKKSGTEVDVLYDKDTDSFKFVSREYGPEYNINLTTVDSAGDPAANDLAKIGITNGMATQAGVDAAGTINGEAAEGYGDLLILPLSSENYGITLTVKPGATAENGGVLTANFSRGVAGEMDNRIARFLADDGIVDKREERLNKDLEVVKADREEHEERMEKLRERLTRQYLAMDRILAQFSQTSTQLDNLLQIMPFNQKN